MLFCSVMPNAKGRHHFHHGMDKHYAFDVL